MKFPDMTQIADNPTTKSLHRISRLMGRVRRELAPPHPHWWHVSLQVVAKGLSTGTIPGGDNREGVSFQIDLDLDQQRLELRDENSVRVSWPLAGFRMDQARDGLISEIATRGHSLAIDQEEFVSNHVQPYDPTLGMAILQSLQIVDRVFNVFRDDLSGERGPVHLWPHHFDLAFVRFTGRIAPGIDPSDVESAKEQVNHGFVFGDEIIPEPYFYVIPYPIPENLHEIEMDEVTLQEEGFTGYVLPWSSLVASSDSESVMNQYLFEATQVLKEVMEG